MASISGVNGYLSYTGSSGSSSTGSAATFVKNWNIDYTAELYETTNFDDSSGGRSYISGFTGWGGTFECNYSTDNTALPGSTGTIILKTSTGTAGAFMGNAVLTNMTINTPVDGIVTQTYTFQGSGALATSTA